MAFVFNSSTGQWEWDGEENPEQPVAAPAPAAVAEQPPEPEKPPEPQKRTAADGYENERASRPWYEQFVGRYNPMFGGIDNLKNDLQYEYNTLTNPETAIPRIEQHLMRNTLRMQGLPDGAIDTLQLGGAKTKANAIKAVGDLFGAGVEGEGIVDEQLDNFYRAGGFRPPSEMTDEELAGDDMRSTLVLNGMLAVGTMGLGNWATGSAMLAKNFPWLARALGVMDVANKKTLLGKAGAFTVSQVVDEIPSTFLDDNTGGSAVQLLGLLGMKPEDVAKLEPVKPGMSRTEASLAAFGPNLAATLGFGGSLSTVAAALPATNRAIKANWARARRERVRNAQVADNTITDPTEGTSNFTPETMEDANAAFEQRYGMAPEPEKLEVDALEETVEATFDSEDLAEALQRQEAGESTIDIVDDISQREPIAPSRSDVGYEAVSAPKENLAGQDIPISERLNNVPTQTLQALADPANSPALAQKITEITGRSPDQFDRLDVIAGIEAMEGVDGRTVMPSRLLSGDMLLVDELNVDAARFQFKQGVDADGRQKGRSLSGVKKFDEEADGLVQVWQDPKDGKVYVVNGHNRVALARDLKIPSLRVQYINARDAVQARAKGAMSNIKDDKGTIWDAAKFMRDSGIKDPQDLVKEGVPMGDSIGQKGFALAKLPENIFIDAQNGRIKPTHAIALGDSGLDETGMQAAYKALLARDMTIDTFNEVLGQVKYSLTVEKTDQVDLFGNTEMLNLMVEKGQLAARIRKDLGQQRRAANNAVKNQDVLEGAGSKIDEGGATSLADNTAALLAQFDATKFSPGPISDLLNQGAEEISNGARLGVVADRIRRGIIEQAETQPAPPTPKVDPEPEAPAPAPSRKEQVRKLVRTAAKNGEVRSPSTPLVETPAVPKIDETARADKQALQMLDNEARAQAEFAEIDEAMQADKLRAERKASGYDTMTFEQKKQNGLLDDLAEPTPAPARAVPTDTQVLPELEKAGIKITPKNANRVFGGAQQLEAWINIGRPDNPLITSAEQAIQIVRRKGKYLNTDKIPGVDFDKALNDRSMGRYTDEVKAVQKALQDFYGIEAPAQAAAKAPVNQNQQLIRDLQARAAAQQAASRPEPSGFVIPRELSKSSPRYSDFELRFESDLDRAAYMLRNKAKKSKGEDRMIAALEEQGFDIDEVRQLGEDIKEQIKIAARGYKDPPGKVPGPKMLEIPASTFDDSVQASRGGSSIQASRQPYDEGKMRAALQDAAGRRALEEETTLLDIGVALPDDVAELSSLSPKLAAEMVEGLKDAARISGLDPLRIQYLDQIETRKLFGENEANAALEQWSPNLSRFAKENPGDPLVQVADGTTGGLYVPMDHQSTHRHMVYLAFGYVLDSRVSKNLGLGFSRAGQKPIGMTGYHEAFHAVQDWLRSMVIDGKTMATKMDAAKMYKAIHSDEALAEMTEMLKKDKWGTYTEGMAPSEIQAEAFAVWYNNRKMRMKTGGLQAAFEYFKKFINTLRRKWGKALGKEPGWVDVFELAASGKIGEAGQTKIKNLRPEQLERLKGRMTRNMDQMMPGLTDRIHSYLQQKKAAYDDLNERMAFDIQTNGCN